MRGPEALKELLRTVIADGEFGLTLRTGEPLVVHTPTGSRRVEAIEPTDDEIEAFLRQLVGSRGVREFRDHGVTRFIVPFEGGVRLVGAARWEHEDIHVEVRRMARKVRL